MKLSLSWIFDHIIGSWKEHDIAQLVKSFNAKTAEIESIQKCDIDLHTFFLARVIEHQKNNVVMFCQELEQELILPMREDAILGNLFLVKKEKKEFRWAKLHDWYCSKEGFLPALSCPDLDRAGGWKDSFESEDYILELDNKTITHRPDLWGHRGMAREIAAILNIPLLPEEMLLAQMPIKRYEYFASMTSENPFTIDIKSPELCKRFAGLYVSHTAYRASWLWMAYRLARVDTRPLAGIVDATNYVMLDWSQPIHAFDAATIQSKTIMPRLGKAGETLVLLDGDTVELTNQDLVITDGKKPIALAGIMGGRKSGVSDTTESLFVEAANFDATTIRRSALRCKKRTESSARFEKSLDPMQNTKALLRFLKIVHDEEIPLVSSAHIISLGHEVEPKIVSVEHSFIESRIGSMIDPDFIIKTLSVLEFGVQKQMKDGSIWYEITVPTFRATKDVTIPEDIVEEIVRFFGYDAIKQVLPSRTMKTTNTGWVYKRRLIKQLCAYALHAREVNNYAFYDENFLRDMQWDPEEYIGVANPVSQVWQRLITSLIPHLFKNVQQNSVEYDRLRFFEWNRCWHKINHNVSERTMLAGIFFDQKKEIDFYQEKESLMTIFEALHLEVQWQKPLQNFQAWFDPYQTAWLSCQGISLGYAGKVNPLWLSKIVQGGDAFIFELDAQALLSLIPEERHYMPLAKYPGTSLDISMLVPLSVTVEEISACVARADDRIYDVALIDFFQKEEWGNQRSITMRLYARHPEKTLTKDDIDHMYNNVLTSLAKINAVIR